MLVVGITGGVGAGKSSVLQALKDHCNCRIILADDVGNKVKETGQDCYFQIVELLGEEILKNDGSINKFKMAECIFGDKELLDKVNSIIHPAVEKYILNEIKIEKDLGKIDVFFLEAALLIEAGYVPYLDELWYIYSDENIRKTRLKESRFYSDEKINQIMSQQLSDEVFRQHATVVLDNSHAFEDTLLQIKKECQRLHIWVE
ncbi:MAG: dephospho-CoA kinase [Lachnospiraceae bacterium]|nr:dephospho-CoA kinase [Lachnospiraceae bacterium]